MKCFASRSPAMVLCGMWLSAFMGCTSPPPDASFGKPEKTKDDGTVRPIEAPPVPPRFDDALAVVPTFDRARGILTVMLQIKPGFHAYAPGEAIGKPVELVVNGPWRMEGSVQIPPGQKKDLGQLGTSVILEGNVPLTAQVKDGTGELTGTVTVQICTDTACDRPKKHAFAIPSA